MEEKVKKYRLGNQSQEYELREDYLGWLPEFIENWDSLISQIKKDVAFNIFNTKEITETKTLVFHQCIIKDAFPKSFYGEERAEKWSNFAIVSETLTSEKFIIPLY